MLVKRKIVLVAHKSRTMLKLIQRYVKKGYRLEGVVEFGCWFKTYYATLCSDDELEVIVGPISNIV